ncbi:OsmC family protein [Priestia filamentosa]|uniref:OsmC family protein n=1 Tax=Priestia filamentosa TaxID=1402861 RepID=UPI0003688E2C|nr:OsmC family protein [Priestia filamentosa]
MELQKSEGCFSTEKEHIRLYISGSNKRTFSPSDLMIASIASCSGEVLLSTLERKGMAITDIKIETKEKRSTGLIKRLEHVHLHYSIRGTALKEEEIKKVIQLSKKVCPMIQSVQGSISITESFSIL